jgi:hypothetical protein
VNTRLALNRAIGCGISNGFNVAVITSAQIGVNNSDGGDKQ